MLTGKYYAETKDYSQYKILTILNRLRKFMCLKTGFCGMRTNFIGGSFIGNGMNKLNT